MKPSNVLLARPDAEPGSVDVRLLDFGLAQMAEFDTLTALGDIPGTLAYISPERLQGLTATEAADVWGVGVLLWEALAGEHPFWGGDMAETSRRIQHGAEPLARLRPDLPEHVLETVGSALLVNPQRRPTAERLAQELRSIPKRRRSRQGGSKPIAPPRSLRLVASERLVPAALTGPRFRLGGGHASLLPGGLAGRDRRARSRARLRRSAASGCSIALTVAFFPLANISLGLAIVYAALAAAWLALTWKDARAGLLLAAGPLLAPVAALAVLPLAAQFARGRARRAAQAGCAVLLAAVIAGLRRTLLCRSTDRRRRSGSGSTGSSRPSAVAHALWAQLAAHPVLVGEALVLAAAAALLPHARGRGPWAAAIFGAALLAGTALLAPAAASSRSSPLPG